MLPNNSGKLLQGAALARVLLQQPALQALVLQQVLKIIPRR